MVPEQSHDDQIGRSDSNRGQPEKPEYRRLLETFEKNPHEQRVKMPFIMKQSQNRSVQGSGCGADGDDGNTAQYIQKIQNHQIGQGTQNIENAGFNKTVHDGSF